ncbi:MAG: ferrous iron transport protein B [Rikenellaceae bacterium]|nr:ferrous iron transport protein B [Rikenellaceae bacterium]
MRLSELTRGESAIIVRVDGDGDFRRRITEMGFVRGKKITVIRNAPMRDPIEYELMGYEVSLRRAEADNIEVMAEDEASRAGIVTGAGPVVPPDTFRDGRDEAPVSRTINVALIGNPNSGKTSLFNYLSGLNEHVGNYSGVTVDSAEATVRFRDYRIRFTDLPGTYSISTYSPEERVVAEHLEKDDFDVVVNVIDGSNIERNMFLTTQLIDMELNMVAALNMYDELIASGDRFDHKAMGELLDMPFVPTVAKRGRGVAHLLERITERYNMPHSARKRVFVNYGQFIEERIDAVSSAIVSGGGAAGLSVRFAAIRLIEGDGWVRDQFLDEALLREADDARAAIESEYKDDIETVMARFRYGFISGALKETYISAGDRHRTSDRIDSVLTHKVWGFPIFLAIMWLIFYATFTLGDYPMDGIEYLVGRLQEFLSGVMSDGALKDLVVGGIVGGVGSVIVFLPNILLLFLFISLLEDSGYMARAAFIMDRVMHKIGLHGKSFIPLVMGFGCNVPAVMASRIIEDRRGRLITMLITPFMSCSARLPVYLLILGAFFPEHAGTLLFLIYFAGVLLAIVTAHIFRKFVFRGKDHPFVMELPPYRTPSARSTVRHMWVKGSQYLRKMGGVILVAVVIVWALSYYPTRTDSYMSRIGHAIEPVVAPLGFDWKIGVGLMSGVAAKEIIVSTMAVVNNIDGDDSEQLLSSRLKTERFESGPRKGEIVFTRATALSFLTFVLVYFPCVAVISAIRRESGKWRWALFTVLYTTGAAWILSFIVYNIFR